jgi:hypothetical protein
MSDLQQALQSQFPLKGLGICSECEQVVRACGCHTHAANSLQQSARTIQSRNAVDQAWLPVRIGRYR